MGTRTVDPDVKIQRPGHGLEPAVRSVRQRHHLHAHPGTRGETGDKAITRAVLNKVTLNGDAELIGVDASGNTGSTVCSVAPNPA
jgi:hypothetical protein